MPAYTRRPKRKIINSPKFYFANVGVVNRLAKRRFLEPGSELFGKAFENIMMHEIRAFNSYYKKDWDMNYWKLASGAEVDLLINSGELAIEFKASSNISHKHLSGLMELKKDQPEVENRIIVSMVDVSRITNDGIYIYNYKDFLSKLWNDELQVTGNRSRSIKIV